MESRETIVGELVRKEKEAKDDIANLTKKQKVGLSSLTRIIRSRWGRVKRLLPRKSHKGAQTRTYVDAQAL